MGRVWTFAEQEHARIEGDRHRYDENYRNADNGSYFVRWENGKLVFGD